MDEPAALTGAFDGVAPRYDDTFTDLQLGRWLRYVVWRQLSSAFSTGDTVLDLGCGTGEDACFLADQGINVVATDVSAGMRNVTRSKAHHRGLSERISIQEVDLREVCAVTGVMRLVGRGAFDGAYANFGPLNCLADRRPLAQALMDVIKPGGTFIAVVMGPLCPWEVGWYLMHGHPRTAIRRFRKGVRSEVGGGEVKVWYPSPRRLRAELSPGFAHVSTAGVGIFLPPSDMGHLVQRAPRIFQKAQAIDERVRSGLPWTWLNDHYLSVFRRRDEG